MTPRGTPGSEGRFTWQASLALERIANELGQVQAAYGTMIYVVLTRLSSRDRNNPRVAASVSKIAGMARLGYRKTFDILHQLEDRARVISIAQQRRPGSKTQAESIYTICTLRRHNTQSAESRINTNHSAAFAPEKGVSDCTRRRASRAENPIGKEERNGVLPDRAFSEARPADAFRKKGLD